MSALPAKPYPRPYFYDFPANFHPDKQIFPWFRNPACHIGGIGIMSGKKTVTVQAAKSNQIILKPKHPEIPDIPNMLRLLFL